MREIYDFRLFEREAAQFFLPSVGTRLGAITRQLIVSRGDQIYERIGQVKRELESKGIGSLYGGWDCKRKYTHKELAAAELFQLQITAYFEPAAEKCGTIYDESGVCPHCGAGRHLSGELILDLGKAPKGKDFAQTIAGDEWIVSERLVTLMYEHGMTGASFEPVRSMKTRRVGNPAWYRFNVTAPPVETAAPTRFGIDPFDEDTQGRYRCPLGHVAGLNILSELSIERGSCKGMDIAVTRQSVGNRQGMLVPRPLIVISPRLRQLLIEHEIKGFKTEVAYLVSREPNQS